MSDSGRAGCNPAAISFPCLVCTHYDAHMSAVELRRRIKKEIDLLPLPRLESLADYVQFLNRPPLTDRLAAAKKSIAAGKGTNWRKARSDV